MAGTSYVLLFTQKNTHRTHFYIVKQISTHQNKCSSPCDQVSKLLDMNVNIFQCSYSWILNH